MIFLVLAAMAASPQPDCENAMTQLDMNICAHKDYEAADAELNIQWKLTAARMKKYDREMIKGYDTRPGYFETLLKAQRAWMVYRDAHCTSEGYRFRGGSMEPMQVSHCKAALTQVRTQKLRDLIEEF